MCVRAVANPWYVAAHERIEREIPIEDGGANMRVRRAARWAFEMVFPLYAIASTRERRTYWNKLPFWRAVKLFAAVFFILSGAAFFVDLISGGGAPLWAVLLLALALGGLHVIVIVAELRRPAFVLLPMAMIFAAYFLFTRVEQQRMSPEASRQRVTLDGTCLFVTMLLGYRLFLSFTTTEGVAHVALQTELAFAHAIQETLVPPIEFRRHGLEAYGRTVPSAAVGGDLVDLVENGEEVFAYIADVSGHGISAGILMGMVKTAIREALMTPQSLTALLENVNAVLPAVKDPEMYATLAALRFAGTARVEFALVGHAPIVHYRAGTQDVERCRLQQYPLGLMPEPEYVSEWVSCGPGDLFVVTTDGLTETMNEGNEEFGLARLERVVMEHAKESLPRIYDALMSAVAKYGPQCDDRTVLLVRILTE
jgi:hypothetical protein